MDLEERRMFYIQVSFLARFEFNFTTVLSQFVTFAIFSLFRAALAQGHGGIPRPGPADGIRRILRATRAAPCRGFLQLGRRHRGSVRELIGGADLPRGSRQTALFSTAADTVGV